MKRNFKIIACAVSACALYASISLARAESVYVKYRGNVDLSSFGCTYVTGSSFIRRVCYDQGNRYMLILLNETYYHYCAIDAGTVTSLLNAHSMGAFYNASIRGNFDCRINPVPSSAAEPVPANPNVYLPQSGSSGDYFGAIAFSTKSGAVGYSYDYSSGLDAQNNALGQCGADCTVVLAFTNACGALAVGAGRGWGTGWAANRDQAETIAMNYCNARASDCGIAAWACTAR